MVTHLWAPRKSVSEDSTKYWNISIFKLSTVFDEQIDLEKLQFIGKEYLV